jgi:riboflavin biosynthesis pyrimidine reductase
MSSRSRQSDRARVSWHQNTETRYPYGPSSPDPDRLEPLGFPPPWPTRPWIYANVIASRNGILTWKRTGVRDDPVGAIAGGDFTRPGRLADLQLMRYLRACADAVSFGAQTLRDQPDLLGTPDIEGGLGDALYELRVRHGLGRFPLQVIYSKSGRLDLDVPIFNAPHLRVIVITTGAGARLLRSRGSDEKSLTILAAGEEGIDSAGLSSSHERLFGEFGVRYLDCEGGAVVLQSLHQAHLLDEVFVTVTDIDVEATEHTDIKRVFDFEAEGARLISEGRTVSDPGYVFRRWRFNQR